MRSQNISEATMSTGKTEPAILTKRIGSTTYKVVIHFDERGERVEDKILRLIEREVDNIA